MSKKVLIVLIALMLGSVASAQHDQYGDWSWSSMDGIPNPVWLKSTSYDPNRYDNNSYLPTTLYLEFNGNISEMRFVLDGNATPKAIDYYDNKPIVEMELSFDNGEFMYYKFIKVEDFSGEPKYGLPSSITYQFVISDRYRQTISFDASKMLKQMANKGTATIRYKDKNEAMKTETFNLEGLESILEIIYE